MTARIILITPALKMAVGIVNDPAIPDIHAIT